MSNIDFDPTFSKNVTESHHGKGAELKLSQTQSTRIDIVSSEVESSDTINNVKPKTQDKSQPCIYECVLPH